MASPFLSLVAELRTLNGGPKVTYPETDADFPVSERVLRIKRGQHLPTFLQAELDAGRFPNNKLVTQTEVGSDAQWVEVYRRYEVIPGPPIVTTKVDPESGAVITITRTKKLLADITEGVTHDSSSVTTTESEPIDTLLGWEVTQVEPIPGPPIVTTKVDPESGAIITITRRKKFLADITEGIEHDGDNSVTTTESDPIDNLLGWEIVTVWPKGDYYDEDHAKIGERMLPFEFPGYIVCGDNFGIYTAIDVYGDFVGHRQAFSETVVHTTKTWWVISETEPTLEFDELTPTDIKINDETYRRVLFDEMTRIYNSIPVTVPASVPSFTEYYGTASLTDPYAPGSGSKWIGTSRVIRGDVEQAGSKFRWKVTATSVVMKATMS